jgi:hypothetical protein
MEERSGMDFLKSLAFDKSKPGFFYLLIEVKGGESKRNGGQVTQGAKS